ncbi:MAG: Nitroreductase family protein [Candidatus Ozemobacter sibiricus]|uniref:Nitroreductase family protein n=1 Tax=Candidatus Ozemobacter sibiricus TaxID=2268124 RepID=A0A367ZF23_9BACT|nr:MAG: Nitroreductase family protein [Candidatus Ozemobacter sibiricus]
MESVLNLLSRHSVRKFLSTPVEEWRLEFLLKAAMQAPSAGNQMPWEFLVIDDRALLDRLPEVHPYAAMTRTAPMAILVCGDQQREKYQGFWVQDCAAATQNILLAAHGMGLGSVWVGVYPIAERVDALRQLFNVPAHLIPFSLIPVGWPAENRSSPSRFDPSRIKRNRF